MILNDSDDFFVKYNDGVSIDLDNRIFDAHIVNIHRFVVKITDFMQKEYQIDCTKT
jgi:hypothetical protein